MAETRFEIYRSFWRNEWRWRLRAANNRIIANSGEGYHNFSDCAKAVELVRDTNPSATRIYVLDNKK